MGTTPNRRERGAGRPETPRTRRARGIGFALLLMAVGLAAPARAAEFQVTTDANAGAGTLRQAILDMNALGEESNTIVFDLPDDSVITLLTPLEDVGVDVDLDASGVSNLVVQGPTGSTFLRTDTTQVTLIDLATQDNLIEIGARDILGFDTSDTLDILIDTDISDSTTTGGELIKDGLGTLELSGLNSYSGGTTVNEGTLRMTGTPPDSGTFDIGESATLVFDIVDDTFTLNGTLDGSGTLVKRNTIMNPIAEVRLLGGGAFTGLTRIEGGTLTDASGVIRGDVEFVGVLGDPLDLAFDVLDSRTYSGRITGPGNVHKQGFGTLTLLGNNDYTGKTFLDGGKLIGSAASIRGDLDVSIFSTLVFDQATSGTFDGDIVEVLGPLFSPLTLEKRGAGTLALSGDVWTSGSVTIEQGRLLVDGTLIAIGAPYGVAVPSGSSLGGSGFALASVDARGVVAPGPASGIGTFEVGRIDFQSGSILEVDIAEMDMGDTLRVSADADLSGGRVRAVPGPGSYTAASTVTILQANTANTLPAGTALSGAFLGLETDFAFLTETLVHDFANDRVRLTLVSNGASISSFATTPNQLTVAQALELEAPGAPGSDLEQVFENIRVIPREQVEPMLDALGGEPLSAFPTARLAMGERFNRAVHRRLRDMVWSESEALYVAQRGGPAPARSPGRRLALGPSALAPMAGPWSSMGRGPRGAGSSLRSFEGDTGFGGWLDGWAVLGDLEGDGNSADVDYRILGATLGLDYRFTERIAAGLAAGYGHADIDLAGRESEGEIDALQGALYLGYVHPRFHLSASGRYAHGWNDSARHIAFSAINRTAKVSFDSRDLGARAEVGAKALRLGSVTVAPLAAFDWAELHRDDLAESGAISLDLLVESDTTTSLLSSVGGSLQGLFEIDEEVTMLPELRAFWLHEFGDRERVIQGRWRGADPSNVLEIIGAEVPRDRILVGLGWSASIGDVVRVFADYDVALASGLIQHEATLTVRIHF